MALGERAIAVERYDRRHQSAEGPVLRVHQEDMCQALGIPPTAKYQSEGGPSPEQIIDLLRTEVRPAHTAEAQVADFVDALALNWIIAGTDAHAKNYSPLLSGARVRLAPLERITVHARRCRQALVQDRPTAITGHVRAHG